ncbi:multicopper oxidase family protein [Pseudomonas benzenivorans]|uniref:multicopper oxidase family protein n=1 Tax=Pseudomonas benzenivorans TaxID=556533 RepID=UPI003511042E
MILLRGVSKARPRVTEVAAGKLAELVRAYAAGEVNRRDFIKLSLALSGGLYIPLHDLGPWGNQAFAGETNIPTGLPPSPLFGVRAFTQPMPRFDVLPRKAYAPGQGVMAPIPAFPGQSGPDPTEQANTTRQPVPAVLGGGTGPIEGRPPGPIWAHQQWQDFFPNVAVEVTQEGAKPNTVYQPGVPSALNSGIDPKAAFRPAFHPDLPDQGPLAFWTFNGTFPPKLLIGRYHEAILFRHHNRLPADPTRNGGFGIHTITTHEHNGHHGAENDGFTGAFFFPGQFYDYHYPICHGGYYSLNLEASDARCGSPTEAGGIDKLAGDYRETMSTHWFHDHMFSFTAQNVYKGNVGMFNIYSSLDRGNEELADGANLRLPSGSDKSWGNLDYDVNLMLADKAWDRDGQLAMDIFDFDGFLGDVMTVNLVYKPYFEVERRKYRFRILNAAVARFFKLALSDASPMIMIANDGNLLPSPVVLSELDEMGIAERYDIVIDFSRYRLGDKVWLVNLAEHRNGRRPHEDLSLREALAGKSDDPCVGRFCEFRIVRNPARPDKSQVPAVLVPNPDLSRIPVAATRVFEFGRGANQTTSDPVSTFFGPWGIKTDDRDMLAADFGRISAAPRFGTREIWTLKNGGGGWDHPIHIHFEEGQILARDGKLSNVPAWERGRKDVYRLRPGGSVTLSMQFRDFGGMFMEHCHNTTHEDNAMLLRWEIDDAGGAFLRPLPTPIPTPQGVTFLPPTDILKSAFR